MYSISRYDNDEDDSEQNVSVVYMQVAANTEQYTVGIESGIHRTVR